MTDGQIFDNGQVSDSVRLHVERHVKKISAGDLSGFPEATLEAQRAYLTSICSKVWTVSFIWIQWVLTLRQKDFLHFGSGGKLRHYIAELQAYQLGNAGDSHPGIEVCDMKGILRTR